MKRFVVAVCCVTVGAVAYVWQRTELVSVSYQIHRQEAELSHLVDQQRLLQYNVLTRESPSTLQEKLEAVDPTLQLTQRQISRTAVQPERRIWRAAWLFSRGIAEASVVK
jgi:hypothetical protein